MHEMASSAVVALVANLGMDPVPQLPQPSEQGGGLSAGHRSAEEPINSGPCHHFGVHILLGIAPIFPNPMPPVRPHLLQPLYQALLDQETVIRTFNSSLVQQMQGLNHLAMKVDLFLCGGLVAEFEPAVRFGTPEAIPTPIPEDAGFHRRGT